LIREGPAPARFDEIFIAERMSEDALTQQIRERVGDGIGNTQIGETAEQPLDDYATEPGTPDQLG